MKNIAKYLGTSALLLFGIAGQIQAVEITLTAISTPFPTPIGIDHYEPNNTLIMTRNYPSGAGGNFVEVAPDGTQSIFAPTVSGLTDEIKIASVRSGNVGGFTTGDLFTGNGIDGQIMKISTGGTTVINPWVSLPGAGNGLIRGSLYVDRTGVYGGDLIVATTGGEIWRVDSAGTPTFIADIGTHLEGLITVPDEIAYGSLAGKIIAGAEGTGLLHVFDDTGLVASHSVGVNIEDIDIINPNENFFGVNFSTGRLLGAEASQFTSVVGGIMLTQEFHGGSSGLFLLDPLALTTEAFTLGAGSFNPGQWEHVTFSSAGVVEIPPIVNTPEPTTLALLGLGLFGLGFNRRKTF